MQNYSHKKLSTHNISVLEVSENTLNPKPSMASKIPRYRLSGFQKKTSVSFLTITGTTLHFYIKKQKGV